MTTITCKAFRASPLPTGEIQLEIESPKNDAVSGTMTLEMVAGELGKSTKSIYRLSTRAKDPLPVRRGQGRPFVLRHELNRWLGGRVASTPRSL